MKSLLLLPLAFLVACGDGKSTGPDPDPVSVATTSLPDGTVGASYNVVLAASGGTGSYGWTLASGSLPTGLTLSAGGAISGTPTTAGSASFTVRATSGTLSGTRGLSINIQPPDVVITTNTLPGATAGAAYSQTLAASGGTGTFAWTVSNGALPAGLTLSAGGVISGTPTAGGTSTFTVQVSSGTRTASKQLSIAVAFPNVTITTTTLPDGTVGTAYSQNLAASGGSGTYNWALTAGTLPAGLTLYASGNISGTPTAVATSSFTVQATSGDLSATRTLSITVQQPAITITTTSLPAGVVGTAYSQTLASTGALGAVTWSITSGALPAGLVLSAAGTIAGTPTAAGSFTFSVRASSGAQAGVASLTIVIQPPPVTITSASPLPPAIQGLAYSQALAATGGTGSYTWTIVTGAGLPAGLTLSAGGVISGTPTAQGTSNFTVQVTSGVRTATKDFSLTVQAPNVTITTTTLPAGVVGDPYDQTLAASGGTGTYAWTVTSGVLPPGLVLTGNTGRISGTPSTQGTFGFTVQAASGTQTASANLTITILAGIPTVVITTAGLPGGNQNEAYFAVLSASGGTGVFSWTLVSGSLPPDLILNASGAITGTATTQGTSNFTVQASSGGKTATKDLSITIGGPIPDVVINTTTLPNGSVGTPYSQALSASGGNGSYTWSVVSGLPAGGLSLSSSGVVSGTPTTAGDITFTVRASSGTKSATTQLTVTVAVAPVVITTSTLANCTINVACTRPLSATGGSGALTWSNPTGSVPAGMTFNANGSITGTPTATGTSNFRVIASDGVRADTADLSLTVAYPAVNITTTSPLAGGTVGTAYSATLVATGGNGTYSWSQTGGTIPPGLTVNSNGTITGNPSTAGTYNFTVQASSGGQTASKQFQIVIAGASAIYLNVGDNPTATVSAGNTIAIPIVVDMSQHGTLDIASISVTVSWDPARFDYVSPTVWGGWVDDNGDPASATPVNTDQVAAGQLTFGGTTFGPTTHSFVLRTVTLRAKATTGQTAVQASVNAAGNAGGTSVPVTTRDLNVTVN